MQYFWQAPWQLDESKEFIDSSFSSKTPTLAEDQELLLALSSGLEVTVCSDRVSGSSDDATEGCYRNWQMA